MPITPIDEWLSPGLAIRLRLRERILAHSTPYQQLELVDTEQFGLAFLLDGHLMSTERDEWLYHENLNQIPALSHPDPRTALIIGGGDGGSARQLLMHPGIRHIDLCELDADVVHMARQYLGRIHQGSLDNPRVHLHIGDGWAFVRESQRQYDLLILDLTDPIGPAAPLYDRAFFADCARLLGAEGVLSLHLCSPQLQPASFQRLLGELQAVFACVRPILVPILSYGGLWSLACASQQTDPLNVSAETLTHRMQARGLPALHYYNPDMHRAGMMLPNFVQALMPSR